MSQFKLNRREFFSASAGAMVVGGFANLPEDYKKSLGLTNQNLVRARGFSILQGLTTPTYTQLTVDVPKEMQLRYDLIDTTTGKSQSPQKSVQRVSRDHSTWAVDRVSYENLQLGRRYMFQVSDASGAVLDQRFLQTLDLYKREARVAVISCQLDYAVDKTEKWESVFRAQPDMCFFIGDTVYGDTGLSKAGPEMLWRRFIESREDIPFYHVRDLIPCIAVWDDHDFGQNDANFAYPHKEDSLKTFKTFFAQDQESEFFELGPTVGSVLRAFGHDFVFIDNRYYRDSLHDGDKSFWGKDQVEWVRNRVLRSADPLWILQGCQFFGGYGHKGQDFEKNYQTDFSRFKSMVRSAARPTLLLSGDVHYTELMEIEAAQFGFKTYEIVSSSMHSFPRVKKIDDNPRRKFLESSHNHILVDILGHRGGAQYKVTCLGKNSKVNFSQVISI